MTNVGTSVVGLTRRGGRGESRIIVANHLAMIITPIIDYRFVRPSCEEVFLFLSSNFEITKKLACRDFTAHDYVLRSDLDQRIFALKGSSGYRYLWIRKHNN